MSGSLTDVENFSLGVFAAFVEAISLQPTLYWKNARAQGLPFTINPRVIYRGTAASVLNEMQMMGMQFGCTGALQRLWMTHILSSRNKHSSGGNETRMDIWNELGLVRRRSLLTYVLPGIQLLLHHLILTQAALGGAISAVPTTPIELVMIHQQLKGLSLSEMTGQIVRGYGIFHRGLMRGLIPCMIRDAVYTCGLLGITPYTQEYLISKGHSLASASLYASVVGGCSAAFFSHPADMIKICMQADLQQERYTTFSSSIYRLIHEKGPGGMFRGLVWRSVNIVGTVFIANEIRNRAVPFIVEHRSADGQKVVT